jgi:hypothetical protein
MDPGHVPLLGRELRLAQPPGADEPVRPVHHRNRRPRCAFQSRAFAACRRDATSHHARLAKFRDRIPQGDRAANPIARLGNNAADAFDVVSFRILGQTEQHGMGSRPHRADLDRADGPPRLQTLRSPGWRLGISCDNIGRRTRSRALRGYSHTLAMDTKPRVDGEPTALEQRALQGLDYYRKWDSVYSKQQATRPQNTCSRHAPHALCRCYARIS